MNDILYKNEVSYSDNVILNASYAGGLLTCSSGIYPAILSPNMLKDLQENNIDLSIPNTLVLKVNTLPPNKDFRYIGKEQVPYLSFIIDGILPKQPDTLVVITGKVIHEVYKNQGFDYVMIKVGDRKLKLNGSLEQSDNDARDCIWTIKCKIVKDRLIIVDGVRLNSLSVLPPVLKKKVA